MKKVIISALTFVSIMAACSGNGKSNGKYPDNFNAIGDEGRVAYVISKAKPDSVARFIIYTALGRNKDAKIDSLAIATNYAYDKLKGDDLESFSEAYDAAVESLPLGEKMKIYKLAGSDDPQRLGYELGTEYMISIRDGNKSVEEVDRELQEFKKACAQDTATYRRFIIGFQTVLKLDNGKDVPQEIYKKYSNTQNL